MAALSPPSSNGRSSAFGASVRVSGSVDTCQSTFRHKRLLTTSRRMLKTVQVVVAVYEHFADELYA